jgi:hypothetical protein
MTADEKKAMSTPVRFALASTVGALLGLVGSSLGGPSVISWWYEPPSRDAFSCAGSVKTALSQFVAMQLGCAAVGAAVLALGTFLVRRSMAKKQSATATAP